MSILKVGAAVGTFAEDKDIARDLRMNRLTPALEKGEDVTLDFDGVELATQSFIHALISDSFVISARTCWITSSSFAATTRFRVSSQS